jgi:hypothetical protein
LLSSIVSIILCFVGITWEATGFSLYSYRTCVSDKWVGDEHSVYGDDDPSLHEYVVYGDNDPSLVEMAEQCAAASSNRDCACINGKVSDSGTWQCFTNNMNVDTCEPLLTTLPPLFVTSFSFLLFMLVATCAYSCCTCCTLCCHNSAPVVPINESAPVPVLAAYQPVSQPYFVDGGTNIYTTATAQSGQEKYDPTIAMTPVVTAYAV